MRPNTLKEGPCTLGAFKLMSFIHPTFTGLFILQIRRFYRIRDVLFNKGVGRTDLYGGSKLNSCILLKKII